MIHLSLKQKKYPHRGFTLIELLVVVSIIGLLMIGGTTSYVASRNTAEDGRRRADLETLRQTLELYRNTNGSYPVYAGSTEGTLKTTLTTGGYISSSSYPKDPDGDKRYYYQSLAPGSTYQICAWFNTAVSGFSCTIAGGASSNCVPGSTTAHCNYGVTQP